MTSTFESRVTKDSLVFSAAHFITYNGNICERLHGHNWRVDVAVAGQLDENHYVYDFIALRDATQELVSQLDHRVLLPDRHPQILIESHANHGEVTARFESRRWVFPVDDCCILPVANTTAELIADWFAENLFKNIHPAQIGQLSQLKVGIEENFGQWAWCCKSV
ncbi:MAG: 6-pyruvoyl tetrahydropterin synthase family protein [Fuerstiella sp.]|nr:6-pyruvoyl tetrahydropterin synthase family protein [Fuerstiella sp.]